MFTSVRVPDNVVEDDQPLELQLKFPTEPRRQRFVLPPPEPIVGVFVAVHKDLEGADLRWQADAIEVRAHRGELVHDNLLHACLLTIQARIIEHLAHELHHSGVGYDAEAELAINQAGARLAQVALIRDQAAPAEAARTAEFVHPFRPLWVQPAVRLLVLRLEYADYFLTKDTRRHS